MAETDKPQTEGQPSSLGPSQPAVPGTTAQPNVQAASTTDWSETAATVPPPMPQPGGLLLGPPPSPPTFEPRAPGAEPLRARQTLIERLSVSTVTSDETKKSDLKPLSTTYIYSYYN